MRAFRPLPAGALGLVAIPVAFFPTPASAQQQPQPVDQADPAVVARQQQEENERPRQREAPRLSAPASVQVSASTEPITPGAIYVEGATELRPADFAPAIEPYLGRPLGEEELRALTRDVAEVARRAGFGLATAWVPRQSLVAGVLRVQVDEGRIDAVEVSGNAREAVSLERSPCGDLAVVSRPRRGPRRLAATSTLIHPALAMPHRRCPCGHCRNGRR